MKVVHFVHMRMFNGEQLSHTGGLTVKLSGELDETGYARSVDVQVAQCNAGEKRRNKPADAFVKREGRLACENKPVKNVLLRYLPDELRDIAKRYARHHGFLSETDYSYTLKYFLPKE